jgi:hypothetical protein
MLPGSPTGSNNMRLSITGKLFLGVLATSVLVALVMAVTGRVAFQRDFRQYVEAAETRRVESLAATLAAIYEDSGDWSALAGLRAPLARDAARASPPGREAGRRVPRQPGRAASIRGSRCTTPGRQPARRHARRRKTRR